MIVKGPNRPKPTLSGEASSSATVEILKDGTEILHDQTTTTTRWVLYRHQKTKGLNLAIAQGDQKVSVGIENLKYLMNEIVPKHESPNDQALRPAR